MSSRIRPPHNFTPREVDVLTRVAMGQSVPDIARDLLTPIAEVNIIIAMICSMLGVDGRTEAVRIGFERGIINSETINTVHTAKRRSKASGRRAWFSGPGPGGSPAARARTDVT